MSSYNVSEDELSIAEDILGRVQKIYLKAHNEVATRADGTKDNGYMRHHELIERTMDALHWVRCSIRSEAALESQLHGGLSEAAHGIAEASPREKIGNPNQSAQPTKLES